MLSVKEREPSQSRYLQKIRFFIFIRYVRRLSILAELSEQEESVGSEAEHRCPAPAQATSADQAGQAALARPRRGLAILRQLPQHPSCSCGPAAAPAAAPDLGAAAGRRRDSRHAVPGGVAGLGAVPAAGAGLLLLPLLLLRVHLLVPCGQRQRNRR